MSRRNRWLALPAGIGLALAMTAYAFAYGPQVPHTITVTPSSATILCGHPEAVFATVLDQDGLPIKDVIVTWSFTTSPSSDDRILQATSKTNKGGVARTMVKLACVAGDRTITASAGGVSGSAVVHVDVNRPGKGQGAAAGPLGNNAVLANMSMTAVEVAPAGVTTALVLIGVVLMGAATLVIRRALGRR
jgi:hypothetical protein